MVYLYENKYFYLFQMVEQAKSCDTFVVLPPLTKHGVVFGKNSDRPKGEVQDVVYIPASESSDPVKVTNSILERSLIHLLHFSIWLTLNLFVVYLY